METLWQDLRFGARMLLKHPGFTAVAVLTLALGIGANSAVFSVINGVLLRPLPYREPERLAVVWENNPERGIPYMFAAPPNFADWRDQNQVFQEISVFRFQDFNLTDGSEPERIQGAQVSANVFSLLGVTPALGRGFESEEDKPGAPSVVILSHGLWQRRFGASSNILGQNLTFNGERHTVVGVMPPGFEFPPPITLEGAAQLLKAELWSPLRLNYAAGQRGAHYLSSLARLREGVSLEGAQANMETIAERLARDFPGTNAGWGITLVSLHQQVYGKVQPTLLVLLGAVGFVLLIACANVANVLLARAAARQREVSIRLTLGASRLRLMRQLFTESALLAALGGIAGLLLAAWSVQLIIALGPRNIPRLEAVSMDARVVGFTLLVSLLAALACGLAPALQTSRFQLVDALKEGGRGLSESAGRQRLRSALVVAEIALSLLLLVGAGLLLRSFLHLQSTPLGFQPENLVTMTLNLPRATYPEGQQRARFVEQLLPKVKALPGIQAAGIIDSLPLGGDRQGTSFTIEGKPELPPGQVNRTNFSFASPGYFRAMGVALLRGREFTTGDNPEAPRVVIINNVMAQVFFPGEDPIGKRLLLGFRAGVAHQVVGVVADERHDSLQQEFRPNVYLPYTQVPVALPLTLVVRATQDPAAIAAAIRSQVQSLDASLPLYDVRTMDQVLSTAVAQPRFLTSLLLGFAGVALTLAAVGIYGVMSYTVTQNTREIGIRMALGAQQRDVLKLIVGQGFLLTSLGVVIGVAGAFGLTRLMASLLYGVTATDPLTFVGVSALLVVVALLACYLPARRATKVDPMVALRYE